MTPERREERRKYKLELEARWIDAGRCLSCGKAFDPTGHLRCDGCLSRCAGQLASRKADRDAAGLCVLCGRERDRPGAKKCKRCHRVQAKVHLSRCKGLVARGRCAQCGRRREPGRQWRCAACFERCRPESRKGKPHKQVRTWTDIEVRRAVDMAVDGKALTEIAARLNRTLFSVKAKIKVTMTAKQKEARRRNEGVTSEGAPRVSRFAPLRIEDFMRSGGSASGL